MSRCHARDGNDKRCTDDQDDHPRIISKDGFWALSHHTRTSWWVERTIERARILTPAQARREAR